MIFAVLFVVSFIFGLVCYVTSNRWWLGGAIATVLLLLISVTGLATGGPRGMAIYFGVPIIFLGSLFGAYIVQLRRAPELDEELADADRLDDQGAPRSIEEHGDDAGSDSNIGTGKNDWVNH